MLLRSLVEKHGPLRWNVIAENFDGRDGQHLRLRWMNHLRPSLDKKPWTPKEDETILRLQVRSRDRLCSNPTRGSSLHPNNWLGSYTFPVIETVRKLVGQNSEFASRQK